jgi:rod shape determining protein RodA
MRRYDLWLLLGVVAVMACSYLAQSSTSRALANPAFATRQLLWLTVGAVFMLMFALVDYRVLARFWPILYVATLVVLTALFVLTPLRGGAQRWLTLGSYTVQPSEFARVVIILAVAALAGEHRHNEIDAKTTVLLVAVTVPPALLVLLQPDLGTAITMAPVLVGALWLGGLPWRVWVGLLLVGAALVAAAWMWFLKPYQRERIETFLNPNRAPYSSGYQQRQSKIAVGSGEIAGKGLHSGTQSQLRFLPAQHTDFIFAVWAEETGFVGSALLVCAYVLLVVRIFAIALSARDRTGAVFAGCYGLVLATQIIVNVGMVTGVAPTTGITLPLLSYGGSSILATFIALGIVQSVWRLRYANV